MPLGLAVWLSTVTYSITPTTFKLISSKSTLHFAAFFFLFENFCLFFFLFRVPGSQQDEFSPSVASLTPPSLCTALLGRKAQGRNSTRRSCSVAVSLWCCPPGPMNLAESKGLLGGACLAWPYCLQNLSRHLPGVVLSGQRPHRNRSEGDYAPASENFYMVGGNSRKVTANHSIGGPQPGNYYYVGLNCRYALTFIEVQPWTNHRHLQLGRYFVRLAVRKPLML